MTTFGTRELSRWRTEQRRCPVRRPTPIGTCARCSGLPLDNGETAGMTFIPGRTFIMGSSAISLTSTFGTPAGGWLLNRPPRGDKRPVSKVCCGDGLCDVGGTGARPHDAPWVTEGHPRRAIRSVSFYRTVCPRKWARGAGAPAPRRPRTQTRLPTAAAGQDRLGRFQDTRALVRHFAQDRD